MTRPIRGGQAPVPCPACGVPYRRNAIVSHVGSASCVLRLHTRRGELFDHDRGSAALAAASALRRALEPSLGEIGDGPA